MMFIWTAKPGREESIEWHLGEPLHVPDAPVVNFQASGAELEFLVQALHGCLGIAAQRGDSLAPAVMVYDAADHNLSLGEILTRDGPIVSRDRNVTIERLRYIGPGQPPRKTGKMAVPIELSHGDLILLACGLEEYGKRFPERSGAADFLHQRLMGAIRELFDQLTDAQLSSLAHGNIPEEL